MISLLSFKLFNFLDTIGNRKLFVLISTSFLIPQRVPKARHF